MVRGEPRRSSRCHRGGGLPSFFFARRSRYRASRPLARAAATISVNPPRTMSASGLRVCLVLLTTPELFSENTISSPSVMLISIAPSQ